MGMITGLLLERKIPAQKIIPDSERAKHFKTVAVRNLDERGMVLQQMIEETRRGGHGFICQGAYFGFVEHRVCV